MKNSLQGILSPQRSERASLIDKARQSRTENSNTLVACGKKRKHFKAITPLVLESAKDVKALMIFKVERQRNLCLRKKNIKHFHAVAPLACKSTKDFQRQR